MPLNNKTKSKKSNNANMGNGKKTKQKKQTVTNTTLAVNVRSVNRGANMSSTNGVTVVSHREVVQEGILASPEFGVNTTVAIQPAISTYSHGSPLGSWLPKIATEYDHYEFLKLKLHYIPTCASTQAGLVIMSCDPNPDGLQPDSFSSMKNTKNAVSGPVRERLTLDMTSVVGRKKLLTRENAVSSYPLYDAGRAFIATTAGTGTAVGYVEVEYTVRLSNPQTGPRTEFPGGISEVFPAVYYSGNTLIGTPGSQRFFGTTNANSLAGVYMQDTMFNATGKMGATTMLPIIESLRTAAMNWVSPTSNITYRHTTAGNMYFWRCREAGRYRFTALLPGDWQNFATFGAEMVSWGLNDNDRNVQSGTPKTTQDVIRNAAGELVYIPTEYVGWRGFRSVESGGTDNDDLVPRVNITFTAVAQERVSFLIGVRSDTNIAENANAWVLYDSRMGLPQAKIEYLGSV